MAMRQLLDGLRYFARGRKCRGMVLPFKPPRAVRRQTPLILPLFEGNAELVNKNSERFSIFEGVAQAGQTRANCRAEKCLRMRPTSSRSLCFVLFDAPGSENVA